VQNLKRVLTSELEHENKEYAQDEGLEAFLKKTGFRVEEKPDKVEVLLKKSLSSGEVVVSFLARPPEVPPEEEEPAAGQHAEDDNQSWVDFQASISTGSTGLIFECSTTKGEVAVNNIVVTHDIKNTEKVSNFLNSQKQYRGPDFEGLDEGLQTAFTEYLTASGVDEELASFIENYSLDKEQRLYMEWLGKVKSLL
jgi:complement component 1 Q subcomponent-binding protein